MATISVNRGSIIGTCGYQPAPYIVQKTFRSSGALANARALLAAAPNLDTMAIDWSGGFANDQYAKQTWALTDFAPSAGVRVWANQPNNRYGLDWAFAQLDALRALTGRDIRMALVMHDHPGAMLSSATLVSSITAGATSLTLNPAIQFGSAGDCGIIIDNEFIRVTGGQGTTTLTIARSNGVAGSGNNVDSSNPVPVPHAGGATVRIAKISAVNQGRVPWPPASQWDGAANHAAALALEIVTRYGANKIRAFSYGQEMKGIANRTLTANLQLHADGFAAFAAAFRANTAAAGVELWFGHLNYWSTAASVSARQTAMDALIAGGTSLEANDETIVNTLMDRLATMNAVRYVDRFTYDTSIIDFSTGDTWRGSSPYASAYANAVQRVAMEYHVQRVLRRKMTPGDALFRTGWGVKPTVAIETYADVNQPLQDAWATESQQAALTLAIAMQAALGGATYHFRWDPESTTDQSPGDYQSWWWTGTGVATKAWLAQRDFSNAIDPGTPLVAASSDDPNVIALASSTTIVLCNTSANPITASVRVTGIAGAVAATLPAYGYSILALPEVETMALTNYAANLALDQWYGAGTPPTYYAQLFVSDPGPLGTSGTPTLARIAVPNNLQNFPAATSRRKTNGLKWSWGTTAGQNSLPDVNFVGVWDAPTGGNLREVVPLDSPLHIADSAEVAIQPGQLAFTRPT